MEGSALRGKEEQLCGLCLVLLLVIGARRLARWIWTQHLVLLLDSKSMYLEVLFRSNFVGLQTFSHMDAPLN